MFLGDGCQRDSKGRIPRRGFPFKKSAKAISFETDEGGGSIDRKIIDSLRRNHCSEILPPGLLSAPVTLGSWIGSVLP